jgi:cobalt/nickel transport system permease protein
MVPFVIFPVAIAAEADLPLGFLMRKVLAVAPFAVLVGVFNPFIDRDVVATIGGFGVSGGWISFASILVRFVLTTTAALVLVATTGFGGVCYALERFRVPDVVVTQLLLLYRYIFVLGEEALRMTRARSLRSFDGRGTGLRVYGRQLGHLLLRTYARASRLYQAMLARGFDGRIRVVRRPRFGSRDLAFVAGWSGIFVLFRLVDVPTVLGFLVTGVFR